MSKNKSINIAFFVILILAIFFVSQYGKPTGYATNLGHCIFDWPQRAVVFGAEYSCGGSRQWCNNNKVSQGIAECCADHDPYRDCKKVGPKVKCVFDWPQEVMIGNTKYSCGGGRQWCNNDKASQGIMECCADHDPYRDCVPAGPNAGPAAPPAPQEPAAPVCDDTDDGKIYNVRGEIRINGEFKEADFCVSNSGGFIEETSIGTGKLKEFYCSGSFLKYEMITVKANERCDHGKIVSAACTPNTKQCQGSYLKICNAVGSGWDQQYCPYGCSNNACQAAGPAAPACKDSDHGRKYEERGDITINDVWAQADYCSSDSHDVVQETAIGSGYLKEFYCTGDDYGAETLDMQSNQKCIYGRLRTLECTPGATECYNDYLKTCNAQGSWVVTYCSAGCDNGVCQVAAQTWINCGTYACSPIRPYCESGTPPKCCATPGNNCIPVNDPQASLTEATAKQPAVVNIVEGRVYDGTLVNADSPMPAYWGYVGAPLPQGFVFPSEPQEGGFEYGIPGEESLTRQLFMYAGAELYAAANCFDSDGINHEMEGYITFLNEKLYDYCGYGMSAEWYCVSDQQYSIQWKAGTCCNKHSLCS